MDKTEKIIKKEWMDLGFQANYFFVSLVVNTFFSILSIYIIGYFDEVDSNMFVRLFGLIALVYLVFLYFYPSVVAFDFIQQYKEKNIPKLKHPNRWIIFFLNFFLGVTGLVWIIIYVWSHIPGYVMVEIVTFEKKNEEQVNNNYKSQTVKVKNETTTLSPKYINSIKNRLLELNELNRKGLINKDEFSSKKKEILDQL